MLSGTEQQKRGKERKYRVLVLTRSNIQLSRQHKSEEVLQRTKTGFHIVLQTRNVFNILLNICKLVRCH
jgi:hypothetical protein